MEINKCLEDPNTQYSDQYMPLAMPAVVEAIQNGSGAVKKYYIVQSTGGAVPSDVPTPPDGLQWENTCDFKIGDLDSNKILTYTELQELKIGNFVLVVKPVNSDYDDEVYVPIAYRELYACQSPVQENDIICYKFYIQADNLSGWAGIELTAVSGSPK